MIAKEYISKWSWVIRRGAGDGKGLWSLPDIGEQVLVVFLYGDIQFIKEQAFSINEQNEREMEEKQLSLIPENHKNIRGKEYYK